MPATSGTPEYAKTAVDDATQLAGVDATAFSDGDLAFLRVTGKFYHLVKNSSAAVNGNNVVATKSGVGRWIEGPASTSGATLVVATLPDVSLISDAPLGDATLVWVQSRKRYFQLDKLSSDALAAGEVVATLSGTGRWTSLDATSSYHWRTQTDYQISATGNDDATGLPGQPIATVAEWLRRVQTNGAIRVAPNVIMTVQHLDATIPLSDPLIFKVEMQPTSMFIFKGTRVQIASGTITGFTPRSNATKTPISLTDAAQDFSLLLNRTIVITASANPANVGAAATILTNTGAPTCRTSSFVKFNPLTDQFGTGTEVVPLVGDSYAVYSITQIQSDFAIEIAGPSISQIAMGKSVFSDFMIATSQVARSSSPRFYGNGTCIVQNVIVNTSGGLTFANSGSTINCHWQTGGLFALISGTVNLYGGSTIVSFTIGQGKFFVRLGFITQGVRTVLADVSYWGIDDMMSFDWTTQAILVDGVRASLDNFLNSWSGISAAGGSYPLHIRDGVVAYSVSAATKFIISGAAANDFQINANATGPAFDRATSTYTALRSYTWALLDTTVAGGGFGGSAMDPANGSAIRLRA